MEINAWTKRLHETYDKALSLYREGNRDLASYFSTEETSALASMGLKPINVYDFVEDFASWGEPDWDTFLLIAAARRDYFLYMQKGELSGAEISESDLPPKNAQLEGIPWLPRIIRKARCFLEGGLCHDIMYCCGGDRKFLRERGIHPADFLREVWAARGDDAKILAFVKAARAA
jgi:hypothetical protein